jgi:hypothetical protein
MTNIDQIRNSIIDKLLAINNSELLSAFNKILETNPEKPIPLDESQIEMLKMSEEDIISGRLISQSEIDKEDAKWLD